MQEISELASEGERLCKSGNCTHGLKYFQSALNIYHNSRLVNMQDMDDQEQLRLLQMLSIIYNQMGNAYFYLQDYQKALECHKKDLDLSEKFEDESGKAKACGNIGNTLQLLGDYDEAILYSLRNLEISKRLNDSTGEARALYNLGNIHQSKGKHMGRITYNPNNQDLKGSEFPNEIKEVLFKAIYYYRKTLSIVSNKDRAAEGRTYGNLGNTYYLLGEFESAIECHLERLKIAKEYGDKAAERRAYSNLGNSFTFQSKYSEAAEYYTKAMQVARALGDRAIEAQSYFSLGNVHILLKEYSIAIDFHLNHLQIAIELEDKIGESRAYWSLSNAFASLGDLDNAIQYANKHLNLARQLGDSSSELTAKMNLYDFQSLLANTGLRDNESGLFTPGSRKFDIRQFDQNAYLKKTGSIDSLYWTKQQQQHINANYQHIQAQQKNASNQNLNQGRLENRPIDRMGSQSNKDLTKNTGSVQSTFPNTNQQVLRSQNMNKEDDQSFLDILSRIQSNRLDDQRCAIKLNQSEKNKSATLPHQMKQSSNVNDLNEKSDELLNLLMKSQTSRLEDQRSSIALTKNVNLNEYEKPVKGKAIMGSNKNKFNQQMVKTAPLTVPSDEDFFSLIQKVQSRRLDEQRSTFQPAKFIKKATHSVVKSILPNDKSEHKYS